jgi:hypothetical protein
LQPLPPGSIDPPDVVSTITPWVDRRPPTWFQPPSPGSIDLTRVVSTVVLRSSGLPRGSLSIGSRSVEPPRIASTALTPSIDRRAVVLVVGGVSIDLMRLILSCGRKGIDSLRALTTNGGVRLAPHLASGP